MRRTIIALLLLMSGATTAVAQPAQQNPPAQAPQKGHCDVGVVSHLGETFHVRIRSWKRWRIDEDVPVGWHIDDLVVDRIRAALGKGAAVQHIPYRKDVEAEVTRSAPTVFGTQFKEPHRWLTIGTRCARYVVVTRASSYEVDDNDLVGLGFDFHNFITPQAYVYALFRMEVYDGETFVRLTWPGRLDSSRKVDPSFSPDPPSNAAQNAKLRDVTRELVARKMDATLPKLLPTLRSQNAG